MTPGSCPAAHAHMHRQAQGHASGWQGSSTVTTRARAFAFACFVRPAHTYVTTSFSCTLCLPLGMLRSSLQPAEQAWAAHRYLFRLSAQNGSGYGASGRANQMTGLMVMMRMSCQPKVFCIFTGTTSCGGLPCRVRCVHRLVASALLCPGAASASCLSRQPAARTPEAPV